MITVYQTVAIASALFAVAAALTWLAVRALLPRLIAWQVIDRPNARSSHTIPVPRGGGLAVMAVCIIPSVCLSWLLAERTITLPLVLAVSLVALTAISWRDDRAPIAARWRFCVQFFAVAATLTAFPSDGLFFQGILPFWLDRALAALAWLWFINLYNFMDGIDGITGVETASIGFGVAVIALVSDFPEPVVWMGVTAAGAAIGFLAWNWSPARVFLGDSGSIPLGYVLGFLLLLLAARGHFAAAAIVPLYYAIDGTTTLLARMARGAPVWQAHREHAYQIAAAARSHAAVAGSIAVLNAGLIVLALAAAASQTGWVRWGALALAVSVTGAVVLAFRAMRRPASI